MHCRAAAPCCDVLCTVRPSSLPHNMLPARAPAGLIEMSMHTIVSISAFAPEHQPNKQHPTTQRSIADVLWACSRLQLACRLCLQVCVASSTIRSVQPHQQPAPGCAVQAWRLRALAAAPSGQRTTTGSTTGCTRAVHLRHSSPPCPPSPHPPVIEHARLVSNHQRYENRCVSS